MARRIRATLAAVDAYADHVERMIEVLRRSPVLHLGGGQTGGALEGSAARADHEPVRRGVDRGGRRQQTAAIVFGPENGAMAETLVFEAAREAYAKGYAQTLRRSGSRSSPMRETPDRDLRTDDRRARRPTSRRAWIW